MSRRYEQKHLLHNWSNCRYRNRAQTARRILRFQRCWSARAAQECSVLMLTGTAAVRCELRNETLTIF